MKHNTVLTALFAAATLAVTAMIFANSFQTGQSSNERSEHISEQVQEIVDPNNRDRTPELWNAFIRKVAHGVEFGVLGICVAGFFICMGKIRQRTYICAPVLYILSAAVADEYIQSFTHRTSMVKDVVIDFEGGLFGLAVTALIYGSVNLAVRKIRRAKNKNKKREREDVH